jgi:rRNA-processing protein CGR1
VEWKPEHFPTASFYQEAKVKQNKRETTSSSSDSQAANSSMGKIRKWKPAQTSRSSSTTAVPQLRSTWEQRLKQRSDRAAVQAAQRAVDETIRAQKRAEREEREAREKRKEENKEKGLQYQVITNTAKIKKMSKKQLRLIRKTDTTGVKPTKKQIAAAAKL